jgi:hypothetical protein
MRWRGLLLASVGLVLVVTACEGAANTKSAPSGGSGNASAVDQAPRPAVTPAGARSVAAPTTTAAPAQAGAAEQAQGQGQTAPLPGLDRKIIYDVTLDLTVKDTRDAFTRVGSLASGSGGFIAESNVRQESDQIRADVTIRVPVDRYLDVLNQLRGIAVKINSEKSSANDVTEEYTDLQSRQRTLEATEQQLMTLLQQAKSVQDVITVQDKLTAVRTDIDKITGRLNLLGHLTDLATIHLTLRPDVPVLVKYDSRIELRQAWPVPRNAAITALSRGWEASTLVLGAIGAALLTAIAFGWWLAPVALALLWYRRRTTGSRPQAAVEAGED